MYKVIIAAPDRAISINKVVKDTNLLDLLTQNGIYIPANCGRKGSCGKCKVDIIIGGKVQTVTSCTYAIQEDITVLLPTPIGEDFKVKRVEQAGIAIDIGTTSIAVYYVDLLLGHSQSFSTLNKQAAFGADVISRIKACQEGRLAELQAIIIKQINAILANIPNISSLPVVISANTTMLHILAGKDPSSIGNYPFTPLFTDTQIIEGRSIGLTCGSLTLLPSAAAYFGADAVCGMASINVAEQEGANLFIDIGTNAEQAISNNGQITACAAAAGPAFEGANIEKGMGATIGAIDHIYYKEGKLSYSVIGGGKPVGICGSGLIDAVALLLEHNAIDYYGTFSKEKNILSSYIAEGKFFLAEQVCISQADIREFQLAKSAVYTGIMALLDIQKLTPADIKKVYIAGGLGYYLDKASAVRASILPKELEPKIISIGNASGAGAVKALLEAKFITKCERLAKQINVIELAETAGFMDKFIENMNFSV